MLISKYLTTNKLKKKNINLFIPILFGIKNNKLLKTFYYENVYYKNFYLIFNHVSLLEVFFKDKKIFYNFSKYFQINLYIYLIKTNLIILNLFFHFFYMLFLTFENFEDIYNNNILFRGYKQRSKYKTCVKGWIKPDYGLKFYFKQRINSITSYVLNFNIYKNIYFSKYNLFLVHTKLIYKLFYYFKRLQYKLHSFIVLYKSHFKIEKKLRLRFAVTNLKLYENLNDKFIKFFSFYKTHLNIILKKNKKKKLLSIKEKIAIPLPFEETPEEKLQKFHSIFAFVYEFNRKMLDEQFAFSKFEDLYRDVFRLNELYDELYAIFFHEDVLLDDDEKVDEETYEREIRKKVFFDDQYFESLADIFFKVKWMFENINVKKFFLHWFYNFFYHEIMFKERFFVKECCEKTFDYFSFFDEFTNSYNEAINNYIIEVFQINDKNVLFRDVSSRIKETFINAIYVMFNFNYPVSYMEFQYIFDFDIFYRTVMQSFNIIAMDIKNETNANKNFDDEDFNENSDEYLDFNFVKNEKEKKNNYRINYKNALVNLLDRYDYAYKYEDEDEDKDFLSEDGDFLSEDGDFLSEDGDFLSEDDIEQYKYKKKIINKNNYTNNCFTFSPEDTKEIQELIKQSIDIKNFSKLKLRSYLIYKKFFKKKRHKKIKKYMRSKLLKKYFSFNNVEKVLKRVNFNNLSKNKNQKVFKNSYVNKSRIIPSIKIIELFKRKINKKNKIYLLKILSKRLKKDYLKKLKIKINKINNIFNKKKLLFKKLNKTFDKSIINPNYFKKYELVKNSLKLKKKYLIIKQYKNMYNNFYIKNYKKKNKNLNDYYLKLLNFYNIQFIYFNKLKDYKTTILIFEQIKYIQLKLKKLIVINFKKKNKNLIKKDILKTLNLKKKKRYTFFRYFNKNHKFHNKKSKYYNNYNMKKKFINSQLKYKNNKLIQKQKHNNCIGYKNKNKKKNMSNFKKDYLFLLIRYVKEKQKICYYKNKKKKNFYYKNGVRYYKKRKFYTFNRNRRIYFKGIFNKKLNRRNNFNKIFKKRFRKYRRFYKKLKFKRPFNNRINKKKIIKRRVKKKKINKKKINKKKINKKKINKKKIDKRKLNNGKKVKKKKLNIKKINKRRINKKIYRRIKNKRRKVNKKKIIKFHKRKKQFFKKFKKKKYFIKLNKTRLKLIEQKGFYKYINWEIFSLKLKKKILMKIEKEQKKYRFNKLIKKRRGIPNKLKYNLRFKNKLFNIKYFRNFFNKEKFYAYVIKMKLKKKKKKIFKYFSKIEFNSFTEKINKLKLKKLKRLKKTKKLKKLKRLKKLKKLKKLKRLKKIKKLKKLKKIELLNKIKQIAKLKRLKKTEKLKKLKIIKEQKRLKQLRKLKKKNLLNRKNNYKKFNKNFKINFNEFDKKLKTKRLKKNLKLKFNEKLNIKKNRNLKLYSDFLAKKQLQFFSISKSIDIKNIKQLKEQEEKERIKRYIQEQYKIEEELRQMEEELDRLLKIQEEKEKENANANANNSSNDVKIEPKKETRKERIINIKKNIKELRKIRREQVANGQEYMKYFYKSYDYYNRQLEKEFEKTDKFVTKVKAFNENVKIANVYRRPRFKSYYVNHYFYEKYYPFYRLKLAKVSKKLYFNKNIPISPKIKKNNPKDYGHYYYNPEDDEYFYRDDKYFYNYDENYINNFYKFNILNSLQHKIKIFKNLQKIKNVTNKFKLIAKKNRINFRFRDLNLNLLNKKKTSFKKRPLVVDNFKKSFDLTKPCFSNYLIVKSKYFKKSKFGREFSYFRRTPLFVKQLYLKKFYPRHIALTIKYGNKNRRRKLFQYFEYSASIPTGKSRFFFRRKFLKKNGLIKFQKYYAKKRKRFLKYKKYKNQYLLTLTRLKNLQKNKNLNLESNNTIKKLLLVNFKLYKNLFKTINFDTKIVSKLNKINKSNLLKILLLKQNDNINNLSLIKKQNFFFNKLLDLNFSNLKLKTIKNKLIYKFKQIKQNNNISKKLMLIKNWKKYKELKILLLKNQLKLNKKYLLKKKKILLTNKTKQLLKKKKKLIKKLNKIKKKNLLFSRIQVKKKLKLLNDKNLKPFVKTLTKNLAREVKETTLIHEFNRTKERILNNVFLDIKRLKGYKILKQLEKLKEYKHYKLLKKKLLKPLIKAELDILKQEIQTLKRDNKLLKHLKEARKKPMFPFNVRPNKFLKFFKTPKDKKRFDNQVQYFYRRKFLFKKRRRRRSKRKRVRLTKKQRKANLKTQQFTKIFFAKFSFNFSKKLNEKINKIDNKITKKIKKNKKLKKIKNKNKNKKKKKKLKKLRRRMLKSLNEKLQKYLKKKKFYNKYIFFFKLLLKTRVNLFKNKNIFNFLFLNKLKILIKNILFKNKTNYYNLVNTSFNKLNFYNEYKLWFFHYKNLKKLPFKLIYLYSKFYFNKLLYNLKLQSNFLSLYNNYLKARTKVKYFNVKQSNKSFKKKKVKTLFHIIFYNLFKNYIKYFIAPRKVIFSLLRNSSVYMYYKVHETPRKNFKNLNTTLSFFLKDLKKRRAFYISKNTYYSNFYYIYWAKKYFGYKVYGKSKKNKNFYLLSYYFKFLKSKTFFFNYLINFIFSYIQKINLNILNYIFILNQYKTKLVIESNKFYKYLLLFFFKNYHYKNIIVNKEFTTIVPKYFSYFSMFFKQLSLELINWYNFVNYNYSATYKFTFLFDLCFINHNTMAIYLHYKYKYLYYYRVYSFYIFYIFYYLYNHLYKVYKKLKLKDFKLSYDLIKYNEYNRYYLGLRTRMLILTIRNRYKRGFTVEKIFRSIKFFLRESMKKKELAGYYISIRGRYKRSSRSNKLIIKKGVYSFNKIDLKIDSSYGTLNTKYGIAGIKVIFAFK